MEAPSKELIAPESHQHPEPLTDSSEIQSGCELPVKESPLTPSQVRAIILPHLYMCKLSFVMIM